MRELLQANRHRLDPELNARLADCGLKHWGGLWGLDFVNVDANNYEPRPGGRPAIIFPLFADGRSPKEGPSLVDLVACGVATRSTRTREGIATVLGAEHIEKARETETAVRLFADPIEWLRNDCRGACVVDWRSAHYVLADLPAGIACSSDELCDKVEKALLRPARIPPLFVPEAAHAAV
jgi:hypothetical protein